MRFLGRAEGEGFESQTREVSETVRGGFAGRLTCRSVGYVALAQPCALRPGARHNVRQFAVLTTPTTAGKGHPLRPSIAAEVGLRP
jgi:hypothetical protein